MKRRKFRKQRGGVILESLIGMCFLLFLCFALVELFMMIARQMEVDYASFYGAKALALGYAGENCFKATRVAASGISGRDISTEYQVRMQESGNTSREELRLQAGRYMSLGRPSGVEYEYWYTSANDEPHFDWELSPFTDFVRCSLTLKKPPFLMSAMEKLMNLAASCSCAGKAPEPAGETRMYNYAKQWLDE